MYVLEGQLVLVDKVYNHLDTLANLKHYNLKRRCTINKGEQHSSAASECYMPCALEELE